MDFVSSVLLFCSMYIVTWVGFSVIFVLAILFEYNKSNTLVVMLNIALVYILVSLLNLTFTWVTILMLAVAYLIIGVIWSFWRYNTYITKKLYEISILDASSMIKEMEQTRLLPKNNLNLITHWIIVWPISVIDNIISDSIRLLKMLITDVLYNVYASMFNKELEKYNQPVNTEIDK